MSFDLSEKEWNAVLAEIIQDPAKAWNDHASALGACARFRDATVRSLAEKGEAKTLEQVLAREKPPADVLAAALLSAVNNGHVDCCKALLLFGASANPLLIENGADANSLNKDTKTPLQTLFGRIARKSYMPNKYEADKYCNVLKVLINAGVVANILIIIYLIGSVVMMLNLLIAMMSTSYEKVYESSKSARNVARAETLLRMEQLLPSRLRVAFLTQCGGYLNRATSINNTVLRVS
ncbi:hypothetical protein P43SY_007735 [Pythium insidiosum]|uniref:Ion transport domain-containing protein n=1 Tax=Pythium insidiosum TaxID=114742 RepID=A0AAD5QB65_PYTIN|nr:hypothetical protein P43SY_007735 [Pythium insidiosum]